MRKGFKHTVQCRCVLPQFRKAFSPPLHQFIVFSVLDENDNVMPKIVTCNNCGIVHKIVDITKSVILSGKENVTTTVSISEIGNALPEKLSAVLLANNADLPTYEAVKFAIDNEQWGEMITLTSESIDDEKAGKYIVILSANTFRVDDFLRKETVKW